MTVSLIVLLVFSMVVFSSGNSARLKTVAGTGNAGFRDGKPAEMNKPIRLAPFGENSVVFADINNHAIRIVSLDGRVQTLSGGPDKAGYRDGPADSARFLSPHGVAYNPITGQIFVAEAGNHVIRMMTPVEGNDARYEISTVAGVPEKSGFRDGPAAEALFNSPHSILLLPGGGILVADIGNARIRLVKDGMVSTVAGSGEAGQKDGKPLQSTFKYPMDMAIAGEGSILIADAGTNLIRKLIMGKEVSTLKLQGELKTPHGIAIDDDGIIYIADMGTHRILSIDKDGSVEPVAGTGEAGTGEQSLNKPAAVLVHGNYLWIADLNNHQIKVMQLR